MRNYHCLTFYYIYSQCHHFLKSFFASFSFFFKVIGKPLKIEKDLDPSQEKIEQVLEEYCEVCFILFNLFNLFLFLILFIFSSLDFFLCLLLP